MDDSGSRHIATPEKTDIEMKLLDPTKNSSDPDRDSNKDDEDSGAKLLREAEQDSTSSVYDKQKGVSESQENNTSLNADDNSTIPASSSYNNCDLPPITDSKISPTSHKFPPKGKNVPRRRRTLRLSQKQRETVKRHAKIASKRFVMFMVSHVGLTCVIVAYSIMGGVIFQALEGSNEKQSITHIHEIRKRHAMNLWNVTDELNIFEPLLWREKANEVLKDFQMEIYQAVRDKGWDGTDNVTSVSLHWTFAGSLLYSVTVITTIGYGHLTPKTTMGRVVTMLYALIGIPMTLLCLANIGTFMAHCFRLLWKQIVCKPCRKQLKRRSMYLAAKQKAATAAYIASLAKQRRSEGDGIEARRIHASYNRGNVMASSDSPITVHDSTALLGKPGTDKSSLRMSSDSRLMGFEGLTAGESVSSDLQNQHSKESVCKASASIGDYFPYSSNKPQTVQPQPETLLGAQEAVIEFPTPPIPVKECQGIPDPVPENQWPEITGLNQPDPQQEEVKKTPKPEVVRVPIMVCLVMVTCYIILGAVLFSVWEGWNYFDSSYFCFITLSTIGFGDMVPGYEHNTWDNQAKRVSCTLYLLFGLALVAMCFELIQSECRQIFNDLARNLGFTDSTEGE